MSIAVSWRRWSARIVRPLGSSSSAAAILAWFFASVDDEPVDAVDGADDLALLGVESADEGVQLRDEVLDVDRCGHGARC